MKKSFMKNFIFCALLLGKILVFKSYSMGKILSLNDENKTFKVNDNVQKLQPEKSEDLILLREKINTLNKKNIFKGWHH